MNVTGTLQTILCAGVSDLVLARGVTELFARGGERPVEIRHRVRRRPQGAVPDAKPGAPAPGAPEIKDLRVK